MSIKNEEVLHVPNWNAQRVENWMLKRKLPVSMTGIFRMKYSIDGQKLLNLEKEEVRELCREANASKKHEFIVIDSIQNLQRQYYDVQRGYTRNTNTNQSSRRRSRKYNRSGSYNVANARKYRKHWTEAELRKAWKLWLKYENLKTVSSKIGRTYIATLTKINLIRRSALESNNAEYEANITDPDKVHYYDLTLIVKQQKEKEDQKDQWSRMKDSGVNVEFEELGEVSTDEEYDLSESDNDDEDDDDEKQGHSIQRKRKRGWSDMSLSEDESEDDDDEPISHRLNRNKNHKHNYNHNNTLKRRFMDERDNESESDDEDEEEIQQKQQQLWENDRHVTMEEREELEDKGIYVVEALREHKKDDEDEEWQFYVKWLDYDSDENTWEPQSNIPPYMVKEYWERRRKSRNNKQHRSPPKKRRRIIIDDEDDSDIEVMK